MRKKKVVLSPNMQALVQEIVAKAGLDLTREDMLLEVGLGDQTLIIETNYWLSAIRIVHQKPDGVHEMDFHISTEGWMLYAARQRYLEPLAKFFEHHIVDWLSKKQPEYAKSIEALADELRAAGWLNARPVTIQRGRAIDWWRAQPLGGSGFKIEV